jgi:hypothetical protein
MYYDFIHIGSLAKKNMVLIATIVGLLELRKIPLNKLQIIMGYNNRGLDIFIYSSVLVLIIFFIQIFFSTLMRINMAKTKRTEIFTKIIYFSIKLSIIILLASMLIIASSLVIIYTVKINDFDSFEGFFAVVLFINALIQIIIIIANGLISAINNGMCLLNL